MSHPVWVRGLKHGPNAHGMLQGLVAPRVGAWIETANLSGIWNDEPSHPVWVRGLKRHLLVERFEIQIVAPRVGAWIETEKKMWASIDVMVAPRVGAWIETPLGVLIQSTEKSHPVWVRGLKLL